MNRAYLSIAPLLWMVTIANAQPTAGDAGAAIALERAMVATIARAEQSVVSIVRGHKQQRQAELLQDDFIAQEFATGVVVDRNGLILTNYHALGAVETSQYVVRRNHRPYPAEIVAADPWSDLAVLRIAADDLQPILFGDTSDLRKGQFVIALGNPYAIAREGSASATWGIISNFGRKAAPHLGEDKPDAKETIHHFGTLIQTDARLKLGTSGGPLLNLRGEMIGLTTALAALSGFERSTGFAVPVDAMFKRVVEQLKQGREVEYGFLGVASTQIAAADRQSGQHGVRLQAVVAGSPAQRAGLVEGDVVTHIGDMPVHDSDDLFRVVGSAPVGSRVSLRIVRENVFGAKRAMDKQLTLSKKHVGTHRPILTSVPAPTWRGMRVDFASASAEFSAAAQGGAVDAEGCVAVVAVQPDSPCDKAGLRAGMFISHVDGQRVATPTEFHDSATTVGVVQLRPVIIGESTEISVPAQTP